MEELDCRQVQRSWLGLDHQKLSGAYGSGPWRDMPQEMEEFQWWI